jgi:hypothetical protein
LPGQFGAQLRQNGWIAQTRFGNCGMTGGPFSTGSFGAPELLVALPSTALKKGNT